MSDHSSSSDGVPDPDQIVTQQDFGRALTLLRNRAGLTVRQGPHQGAHKSTTTGILAASATSPKVESSASAIHGSA